MIPNPIIKVLSSIQKHRVRALLMGGQACVLYGAAEFSRDTDFAVLAEPANLERLRRVLTELRAVQIAVPPLELRFLRRGHGVHFRCWHPETPRLRIDVMSKMRGVDKFQKLWRRRTSIELPGGIRCELVSLPDLVQAKKTQRDKDWPMIRRLLEAHYYEHRDQPVPAQIKFWLRELRTPELLMEVTHARPKEAALVQRTRPLLKSALKGNFAQLVRALDKEEKEEREKDRRYWAPLKAELEALRRARMHK